MASTYRLYTICSPTKNPAGKSLRTRGADERSKRRYLWNAGDYLNSVGLGHPDGFWLPFVVRIEELFDIRPCHIGEPQHPKYLDGEALIDWHLYFEKSGRRYMVLLRDGIFYTTEGLQHLEKDFREFRQKIGEANVVVVSDVTRVPREIPQDEIFEGLILDTDPTRAAERAFAALTRSGEPKSLSELVWP